MMHNTSDGFNNGFDEFECYLTMPDISTVSYVVQRRGETYCEIICNNDHVRKQPKVFSAAGEWRYTFLGDEEPTIRPGICYYLLDIESKKEIARIVFGNINVIGADKYSLYVDDTKIQIQAFEDGSFRFFQNQLCIGCFFRIYDPDKTYTSGGVSYPMYYYSRLDSVMSDKLRRILLSIPFSGYFGVSAPFRLNEAREEYLRHMRSLRESGSPLWREGDIAGEDIYGLVKEQMARQSPSRLFAAGAVFDIVRQDHAIFEQIVRSTDVHSLQRFFAAAYLSFFDDPASAGVLFSGKVQLTNNDTNPAQWNVDIFDLPSGDKAALCYIPIQNDLLDARIIGIVLSRKGDGYYYCMLNKGLQKPSDVIRNNAWNGVEKVGEVTGRGFELMDGFLDCMEKNFYKDFDTESGSDEEERITEDIVLCSESIQGTQDGGTAHMGIHAVYHADSGEVTVDDWGPGHKKNNTYKIPSFVKKDRESIKEYLKSLNVFLQV